jgi:hypothetical protein
MKYAAAALLVVLGSTMAGTASAEDEYKVSGGIYFAPTFMLAGKWEEDAIFDGSDDEYWAEDWRYTGFTPGFGVFGEYAVHRHLVLGLEGYFAFPEAKATRLTDAPTGFDTGDWERFDAAQKDFMFSLMIRAKAPFRLAPIVSIYPLVGFGFSYYMSNTEKSGGRGTDANFPGLALAVGFGTEIDAHRFVTPFAEVRYMLSSGWHTLTQSGLREEAQVTTHALAILIGVKFP